MVLNGMSSIDSLDLTGQVVSDSSHPSAAGGFANIWVGHWESGTHGPRKVAIKVLRTYTENQKHNRRMDKLLYNEIRVWRRLEHINVLPLYGTVSNFGPCVSMVCPWQENGNLNQFLEMNPTLASHERYRILLGVLSGLLYLHSCSVVHGDLTGSNVLLGERNTVVLSDFGLSTLLSESGTLSHSVSTSVGGRGAVRWTAPEIVIASDDNTIRRPDKSSDTYSFGSIALQALSGRIPYHHLRNDVCVILHLSKGIKPPRPLHPPMQDEIWGLIQNCWDDEPQRRPELTTIERGIQALYVTDGPGAESIMHEDVAPGRPPSCVPDEKVDGPNHHSAAMGPSIFRRLTMRRITSPWAWVPRVLSKMTRQRGSMEMATLKDTNPGLLPGTGTVRKQIGTPDYQGWLRKLDNNSEECWKARFFVLKNSHLYYLRSDSPKENSLKGYINLSGCVILDTPRENQSGGPYGFQIIHRREKSHTFQSSDAKAIRSWISALSKAIEKGGEDSGVSITTIGSNISIPSMTSVLAEDGEVRDPIIRV